MTKPEKFTPEYFLARGFEWEEIIDDNGDLDFEDGWARRDDSGEIESFVTVRDNGLEATLYFGLGEVPFPYEIYDTEWLDELLYTIWRINPDGTKGKVK